MDTKFDIYSDVKKKINADSDGLTAESMSENFSQLSSVINDINDTIMEMNNDINNVSKGTKDKIKLLSSIVNNTKSSILSFNKNIKFNDSDNLNDINKISNSINMQMNSYIDIKSSLKDQMSKIDYSETFELLDDLIAFINVITSNTIFNDINKYVQDIKLYADESKTNIESTNKLLSDDSIKNNLTSLNSNNKDNISTFFENTIKINEKSVKNVIGQTNINVLADSLNRLTRSFVESNNEISKSNDNSNIINSSNLLVESRNQINKLKKDISYGNYNGSIDQFSNAVKSILLQTKLMEKNLSDIKNKTSSDEYFKILKTSMNLKNKSNILYKTNDNLQNNYENNVFDTNVVKNITETMKYIDVIKDRITSKLTIEKNKLNYDLNSTDNNDLINSEMANKSINNIKNFDGNYSMNISDNDNDSLFYKSISGNFINNKENFSQSLNNVQKNSIISNVELNKIKEQISLAKENGNVDEIKALINKMILIIKTNANEYLNLSENINLSKGQYNHLNLNDKSLVDGTQNSLKEQSASISSVINATVAIDPENNSINDLRQLNNSIKSAQENIEESKQKSTFSKIFEMLKSGVSSTTAIIGTTAGIIGLGGALGAKSFASGIFDRYAENGKLFYESAKSDIYMGANINNNSASQLISGMGNKYFAITHGMIDFGDPLKMYSNFARNVGGHYNSGSANSQNDMLKLTKNLFSSSKLYDLDDNTISEATNVFYKDLNMSADDTSELIIGMISSAKQSNIPIESYIKTVTNLSNSLRNIGVSGSLTVDLIDNLTRDGFRLEDASSLISDTANAGVKMGDNLSRSAFYGMMSGQSGDIWNNIESGMLSHDENSKPINGYYQNMGKRLNSENSLMMGIGGGNNPLGISLLMKNLKQQGYSQKSASTIASLAKDGRNDEISKIIEAEDLKKENDPKKMIESIKKADEDLAKSANQLSVITKIKSDALLAQNELSSLLRINFTNSLKDFRKGVDDILDKFGSGMDSILKTIKKISENPNSQRMFAMMMQHPFLTGGALIFGGAILKGAAGKLISSAWKSFKNPINVKINKTISTDILKNSEKGLMNFSKNILSKFGKNSSKIGAIATAVLLLSESNNAEASSKNKNDLNDSDDNVENVNNTLKNGNAMALLVDENGNMYNSLRSNTYFSNALSLLASGVGIYSFTKYMNNKTVNSPVNENTKNMLIKSGSLFKKYLPMSMLISAGSETASAYASGNEMSVSKHIGRFAIDAIFGAGGMAIGATIGSALPGPGNVLGGMIGGYAGGKVGDFVKEQLGLGDTYESVAKDRFDKITLESDSYGINIRELLNSDTEQGNLMRNYLKQNGINWGELNEEQKAFVSRMFLNLSKAHLNLKSVLKMVANQTNKQTTKKGFYNEKGKLVSLSNEKENEIRQDAEDKVNGDSGYDGYTYQKNAAQSIYNKLNDQYDKETDEQKKLTIHGKMDRYSAIIQYLEDLENDDHANAKEEADYENEHSVDDNQNMPEYAKKFAKVFGNNITDYDIVNRWKGYYSGFKEEAEQYYYDNGVSEELTSEQSKADSDNEEAKKKDNTNINTMQQKNGTGAFQRAPDEIKQAIVEASEKYGVSKDLIAAIIEQESSFNPNAKDYLTGSHKGLMQISEDIQNRYGVDNPYDVKQNVMAGTGYLSEKLKEVNGNNAEAIQAYHLGHFDENDNDSDYVNSVLNRMSNKESNSNTNYSYKSEAPKTTKEQLANGIQKYNNITQQFGGQQISGNIVNGMYIDQNQKFESIDDIRKKIIIDMKNAKNNSENDVIKAANDAKYSLMAQNDTLNNFNDIQKSQSTINDNKNDKEKNTAFMNIIGKYKKGINQKEMVKEISAVLDKYANNISIVSS